MDHDAEYCPGANFMTRFGLSVLLFIVAAGAIFASMLSIHAVTKPDTRLTPKTTVADRDDGLPALIVPVTGVARAQIDDTWGQARSESRVHHGTDIMAPSGTPVLAAADGTIEKLYKSRLGGTTLYERSSDRHWIYYYAHLSGYAPRLAEKQVVKAGDVIAYVGDTGDAGAGNYHLHFGLTRTAPDQHWYQGEDVNAYPALADQPKGR